MKWQFGKKLPHKTKYELAIELLEKALERGFPRCYVIADSWYGIEPFIKGLKRLKLSYVLEIKASLTVKQPCKTPRLTPTGKLSKKQYELINLPEFFKSILSVIKCGFEANNEKKEKILYHTKIATIRLNAISGKHRIVESIDPITKTSKYLLSDQLTWEAVKILSIYHYRWTIEEFFRNAKQLTDMEGATIRSKQGVTLALCLVSWIDSLLHFESYKLRIAGKLTQESLTIPSIVRQAQYDNMQDFLASVQNDQNFVQKWLNVEKERIERKRKKYNDLIELDKHNNDQMNLAA